MKEYALNNLEELEENEHIIKNWEPLEFNIDEKYEYVPNGKIFSIFSNILYYGIAFPILKIVTKVIYDLKIEGKENIRAFKEGAISISNHVLFLDCAMVGLACGQKRIYYSTLEDNFKIPFVRKLIKYLRAMPIPKKIENKKKFLEEIEKLLKNNNVVHFYPEAALYPYCTKLRNFKNGAFEIAIKNKVPIVPMIFTFREPKGLRKILKRKKDVTLTVLKPVRLLEDNGSIKERAMKLKNEVYESMLKEVSTLNKMNKIANVKVL